MNEPVKLPNIGPKSAAWLRQIGIRTREQLLEAGALGAFVRIKRAGFRPGLNLLYALEGAIRDCHWRDVPEARRSELLAQADAAGATLPPRRGKPMPPAEPVRTIWADDSAHASDDTHDAHRDDEGRGDFGGNDDAPSTSLGDADS